jgi:Transglutaminase-like superfamily
MPPRRPVHRAKSNNDPVRGALPRTPSINQSLQLSTQVKHEMSYFLSAGAYFCECEDGVIFLNLDTQRYVGLARPEVDRLRSIVDGWPTAETIITADGSYAKSTAEIAESLVKVGVLTQDSCKSKPPSVVTNEARESKQITGLVSPVPRIRRGHLLAFMRSWAWATIRLRHSRMSTLVHDVRLLQSSIANKGRAVSEGELLVHLTAFVRLRSWFYTAQNKCLLDSLVLTVFLFKYGIVSNWVFGVRPKPFQAHCWVQYQQFVLNDSLEHMELYTPILKV